MSDPAKNPETPNVVLICCDHLRADWCGCNGHPLVMIPQIDELAYEGMNFQSAFSEVPVVGGEQRSARLGRCIEADSG